MRTLAPARVKKLHGRGSLRLEAGTVVASRVIRVQTGARPPVRFDLNRLGGRILDRNLGLRVRIRAVPEPGTARIAPHPMRLSRSVAPTLSIGPRATVSRSRGWLRVRLRCHGGDGGACAARIEVRTPRGRLLARRGIRRASGSRGSLALKIRSGFGASTVRVKTRSKVWVGRNTSRSRRVRVR